MDKRTNEKITSIVIAVLVIVASLLNSDYKVGAYSECEYYERLLYPFFHANILHASLNAWCLLSVVFLYDISILRLNLSYIAAVSVPSFMLSDIPTLGMSGVVFFLFASISFEVQRKTYYQSWMLFYLALGFLLPNTNGMIHMYCYVLGLFYALLNKPIQR